MSICKHAFLGAWALSALALVAGFARAEEQPGLRFEIQGLEFQLAAAGEEPAYWIGIGGRDVDEKLRADLKLEAGKGLLIDEIVPGSPAAKIGLQVGDVLISIGKTEVDNISQVSKAIAESKGEELVVRLVRAKMRQTLVIKPERRPASEARSIPKFEAGAVPSAPAIAAAPRVVTAAVPSGRIAWMALTEPGLPDDMEVSVTKRGKGPATVKVKQGDKQWKTTENELDMLPPPARAYAARLLGKAPAANPARFEAQPGTMPGGAQVRQLPGGGIQIEIHEGREQPGANPASARRLEIQPKPAAPSETPRAETNREETVRKIRIQQEQLDKALEELRKAIEAKAKQ